jgi:ABC-2 type transport system ATP-binding protein
MLIQARNLSKSFGELRAVDNIDLQVDAQEIYGLVGPDGAGKTTTMRLLCGAFVPDKENGASPPVINIAGFDLLNQTERARTQIGYLPQRFSMYEELTVLENLRFFAEVRGLQHNVWRPRCMEILEFVGLVDFIDRRAGQLSGGMKQKLGLAAALVHQPSVLLLDEPTTGVDPVTRQDFWQLIIRLVSEEEIAVLVSTPYMDEASRCNRVGFMRQGQLIVEESPDILRERLNGQIIELRGHPLRLLRMLAQSAKDVDDVHLFGDRLHLRAQAGKTKRIISYLEKRVPSQGGQITSIRTIPPQLEDVFIALVEVESR